MRLTLDLSNSCSFYPTDTLPGEVYGFESSDEALDIVARIMSTVALPPNFVIKAANVPNAAAKVRGGERFIFYSEVWVQNMIRQTGSYWAGIALMGHEIGHHLAGHTLDGLGSRPPRELEADRFAGFVVAKLGGTLNQALALFRTLEKAGSETHPPRSARLEAAAVGWRDAHKAADPFPDRREACVAEWDGEAYTVDEELRRDFVFCDNDIPQVRTAVWDPASEGWFFR